MLTVEKLARLALEDGAMRENDFQPWQAVEFLIAADLGTAFDPKKAGHIILGKPQAFVVHAQIVGKFGHVENEITRTSSGLHDIKALTRPKTAIFVENGQLPKKQPGRAGPVVIAGWTYYNTKLIGAPVEKLLHTKAMRNVFCGSERDDMA